MVEYKACIVGLKMAIDMNIKEFIVLGDSNLLIHQVREEWATKNCKILPYLHHIQELRKRFAKTELQHVSIVQNEFADALATLSSMIQPLDMKFIDPILVKIYNQLAYCAHVEEEADGKPWFHDIKEYLTTGEYPELANATQKRTLRRLSNNFSQRRNLVQENSRFGITKVCQSKGSIQVIRIGSCKDLRSAYEWFCLIKKILRAGYFWMTMEIDCIQYVRKCHRFQIHANMIKVPPNELTATSSPWPFTAWGMDVIRLIEPAASNGHMFILVAID